MSYNFETNFYMPYFDKSQGLVPLPFATIDAGAVNQGTKLYYQNGGELRKFDGQEEADDIAVTTDSETNNSTEKSVFADNAYVKQTLGKNENSKQKNKNTKKGRINRKILSTLLSRKKLYKILEHKMDLAGFNGEECLLKTICETAEQSLAEHNGVLGDIVHIIFTPTSSRDEKLPLRYYDATTDGQSGCCKYYNTLCPNGIFDFITKTM
ncbi:uncharacterized protein LOC116344249 isoform X2 [Contarinia nasturtii]|nr:uncharacterized protein LOC116344249 isoform X2 [Contarinia nasturtii]